MSTKHLAALVAVATLAVSASAGNKLIRVGQCIAVAESDMTVQPGIEWNKLAARPGRNLESWTQDGEELSDLNYYGGTEAGRPLFREVDNNRQPFPKVSATMLITDIPVLLDNSYRIALGGTSVKIDVIEPVQFAGNTGVRSTYAFSKRKETLHRRGEALGAAIGGKLCMVMYEAPSLYWYYCSGSRGDG